MGNGDVGRQVGGKEDRRDEVQGQGEIGLVRGVDEQGKGDGDDGRRRGHPLIPALIPHGELVREVAPEEGARTTGHGRQSQPGAEFPGADFMQTQEQGREEVSRAVGNKGVKAASDGEVTKGGPGPQQSQRVLEGRRGRIAPLLSFRKAANGFGHHQAQDDRQGHPGEADNDEGRAPAIELVDPAAQEKP